MNRDRSHLNRPLSLQQVRQVPIFLGRRRRALDETSGNNTQDLPDSSSPAPDAVDMNTTTSAESTTQVIEFTLNGQQERFIVAQEVKVDVYYQEPLFEDYTLLTDTAAADHVISESSGSGHNESEVNAVSSQQ